MPNLCPIVFMGTPQPAAATLERLLNGPDPVVGVVTQPDRPAGRGQKTVASPVRLLAESRDIPVAAPAKIRDPDFLTTLQGWKPELIVVVAYGRILPPTILQLPPCGCLNVHYSILPKYRGAAPVAWAIINGEQTTGVSTMQLVEQMDAGPIYLQREIALTEDETAGSLQSKLVPVGAGLLLESIRGIKEGTLTPRAQDEAHASFAPIIKKEDGLIDWRRTAVEIERRIRGFNPWPSAYTHRAGKLLKIHRARRLPASDTALPGEVVRADSEGFWVATGSGTLSLEEVQLEGKRRLQGVEFIKGARVNTGERF